MADSALGSGIFQAFINYLYTSGGFSVPTDFHSRCEKIKVMLDNDTSGLVNTVTDYAVDSAADSEYKIECANDNVQKLLNFWLSQINININGIPTGLKELSKEYFKERWQGSSMCILRMKNWKTITLEGNSITVPTTLWFVNGSSVYVKRPKSTNYKLGSDDYYLDKNFKIKIPNNKDEYIVVQKPFNRWFDEYPTPYLIRKGVYKNWLGMKTLQDKSDEVISKVLPYLLLVKKGTENLFLQGEVDYTDPELKKLVDTLRVELEKYKNKIGKTPTMAVPFDQSFEHLIPDLRSILTEELYRQGSRSMLSGLGFVDVVQGISSTRKESVLNPKPFVAEVNDGVSGFKTVLLDIVNLIILKNKSKHPKLFGENNAIKVINSPLQINIEAILEYIRSSYDRGVISIQSYIESIGFDYNKEKERRERELADGDEDLFYPHLIQNREDVPDRLSPSKPKNEIPNDKKEIKQKDKPESTNFKGELEADLEIAPYKNLDELPKYIQKMTVQCQKVFMASFNKVLEDSGDESKAMAIGISAAKRCMKKNGYIYNKETKKWEKK